MTNLPHLDALLFDLGGVVVSVDFRRAYEAWGAAAGVPAASVAARFRVDAAYEAHERGEIGHAEYFHALRGTLGIELADDAFLAGWNAILLDPMPGMAPLLRELSARIPIYLFSNTNAAHHACWREKYREVLSPFSAIYCSHELGARKPAAEAFDRVAERIGRPCERIAFFDDLEENVIGARRAGLRGYHVASVRSLRETLLEDLRMRWVTETGASESSR